MDVRFNDVLAFAVGAMAAATRDAVALAGGLMFGATMAEIFTPVAIGRLVDALGGERADPGQAVWALGCGHRPGDPVPDPAEVRRLCLGRGRDGHHAPDRRRRLRPRPALLQRLARRHLRRLDRAQHHARRVGVRHVRRRDLLPSRPVGRGDHGCGRADALALAADGAGLSRRRHCSTRPSRSAWPWATWRRSAASPPRATAGWAGRSPTRSPATPWSRARRPSAREDARLGGVLDVWQAQHAARLVRVDPHRRGPERDADRCCRRCWSAAPCGCGRAASASAGDVAYVLTSFLLVRPLAARRRHAAAHRPAGGQRHGAADRVPPHAGRPSPTGRTRTPLAVAAAPSASSGCASTTATTPTPLFDDLSVTIAAGERVALVGHSGSGKTTFVKLLQRLHEIQGGRILIDGQDIAGATLASLREAIALVPQEPVLFHRSLAENIAYARPDAEPRARSCGRRGWPTPTASSSGCRRATPPWSASAASSCRAASASGSRSPAPSWPTGRSWCWTRRPPRSTARRSS